jgi:hypothetical protein
MQAGTGLCPYKITVQPHIDLDQIYESVLALIMSRDGMKNTIDPRSKYTIAKKLAGEIAVEVLDHNNKITKNLKEGQYIDSEYVRHWLRDVSNHELKPLNIVVEGGWSNICDLIDPKVRDDVRGLYYLLEPVIMRFRPGVMQVGNGEFFLCMFSKSSKFGIDTQSGYDVIIHGQTIEIKQVDTQLSCPPEKLKEYVEKQSFEIMFMIHPVSEAENPKVRSRYCAALLTDHKKVFQHRKKRFTIKG